MKVHAMASAGEPVGFLLCWVLLISDVISRLEVFPLTPLCHGGEINERGADVQLFLPRPRRARAALLAVG